MENSGDNARLKHLLDAAEKAVGFVKKKSRQDLNSDEMLALALVRLLEIVGEAANALSEGFKQEHTDIQWHSIVSTRNRLIHGYFDVDLDIVWSIVTGDLPALIKKLHPRE